MKRCYVTGDERRVARNGDTYAVLTLRDPGGGSVEAKEWNGSIPSLLGKVIEAELENRPFKGRDSWVVRKWRLDPSQDWRWEPQKEIFHEPLTHEWYCAQLRWMMESIEDSTLSDVVEKLVGEHWDTFIFAPAAARIHNAYIGGLLLHTVQAAHLGLHLHEVYSGFFPVLRRDLILSACLLHDWGKMFEYECGPDAIELGRPTEEMALTGHISLAVQAVARQFPGTEPLPDIIRDLIHCIQSHHLILEWGSPTTPALPEAMIVAFADNTDGRLQTAVDLLRNNPDRDVVPNPWDRGASVICREPEHTAGGS